MKNSDGSKILSLCIFIFEILKICVLQDIGPKQYGFYLKEHLFLEMYMLSLADCKAECNVRGKCESFNYYRPMHRCELNMASAGSANMVLEQRTGSVFVTKAQKWDILEGCVNCKDTEVCNATRGSCDIRECATTPLPSNEIYLGNQMTIGSKLFHVCLNGYISPYGRTISETVQCQESGHFEPRLTTCVPGSCRDILLDNPNAKTGTYIYRDSSKKAVLIFCDFHGNWGYTYFSAITLENLSNLEPHYTTSSEASIRHFRSDGSQTESTIKILSRYSQQYNLTFLLNSGDGFRGVGSLVSKPFVALGFIPNSFGNRIGTRQGYNVEDTDIEFTNCDENWSNSIEFFKSPNVRYTCCGHIVKRAWFDYSRPVSSDSYMPLHFSFKVLVSMGGCGSKWSANVARNEILGASLGLKFIVD